MPAEPRVLIVDPSEDTREVLSTALARRGVHALTAAGARRGLDIARREHPHLIVLDLDLDSSPAEQVCSRFASSGELAETRLLLLGSARLPDGVSPRGEFIRKPYHYGPLVRRIEEVLQTADRESRKSENTKKELGH